MSGSFPPYRQRAYRAARHSHETREKRRGRIECRRMTASTVGHLDGLEWPGLRQVIKLERRTFRKGQWKRSVTYAITSVDRRNGDAKTLLAWVRGRWEIENRCFWVRDVVQKEDACRVREGRAPWTLSIVRSAVLNNARATCEQNIAAMLQRHALRVDCLLPKLGIVI